MTTVEKMNPQSAQPACIVCGRKVENNGFARLISGDTSIFLCSPKCTLAYFARADKNPVPSGRPSENDSLQSNPDWYDLDASLAGQIGESQKDVKT
jgi:hypothetical protein